MNKILFKNTSGVFNEAGGEAVKLSSHEALIQHAMTGCFNNAFYTSAKVQLDQILSLCSKVEPEFVAKLAVYASEKGLRKDVPVALCAWLFGQGHQGLLSLVFHRVIGTGKKLRNFCQMIRSGTMGRSSFTRSLKRLVHGWLNGRTSQEIFFQCVGNDPSMRDVIRMTHPRPLSPDKAALYQWIMDRPYNPAHLPEIVRQYEIFVARQSVDFPTAPAEMLMSFPLTLGEWCQLAERAGWTWLRMSLNLLERRGVWKVDGMPQRVADRLADADAVRRIGVYPYQIMTTILNASANTPPVVMAGLEAALEHSLANVPVMGGEGYVLLDISGSMQNPVTGDKPGATTKTRCCHVAALLACGIMRKNPQAKLIGFNTEANFLDFNPNETVLQNATKLKDLAKGGTYCYSPIKMLNTLKATGDWLVMISDNESLKSQQGGAGEEVTPTVAAWKDFCSLNPNARIAFIDIQPYTTAPVGTASNVLNVGGFGETVYDVLGTFFNGELESNTLIKKIWEVDLNLMPMAC